MAVPAAPGRRSGAEPQPTSSATVPGPVPLRARCGSPTRAGFLRPVLRMCCPTGEPARTQATDASLPPYTQPASTAGSKAIGDPQKSRPTCLKPALELKTRGHTGQTRVEEPDRPQPPRTVGGDDVLNGIRVQHVIDIERRPQPAPSDVE